MSRKKIIVMYLRSHKRAKEGGAGGRKGTVCEFEDQLMCVCVFVCLCVCLCLNVRGTERKLTCACECRAFSCYFLIFFSPE